METLREKIIARGIVNLKEVQGIEDFFSTIGNQKIEITKEQKINAQEEQAKYLKGRRKSIIKGIVFLFVLILIYNLIDGFPGWLFFIIFVLAIQFFFWGKNEQAYRKELQKISKSVLSDFIKIFGDFSYSAELKIREMIPKIEKLQKLGCLSQEMDWYTEDYIHGHFVRQGRDLEIEGFEVKMNNLSMGISEQSYILNTTFLKNRYTVRYPIIITNHDYTLPNTSLFGQKTQKVPVEGIFPKDFQIICEDPIEAYTIITHSLSEKLIQLTQKNPNKVYMFCFYENKICIKQVFQGKFFDILNHENITSQPEDFLDFYIQFREIIELFWDLNLFYYSKISLEK